MTDEDERKSKPNAIEQNPKLADRETGGSGDTGDRDEVSHGGDGGGGDNGNGGGDGDHAPDPPPSWSNPFKRLIWYIVKIFQDIRDDAVKEVIKFFLYGGSSVAGLLALLLPSEPPQYDPRFRDVSEGGPGYAYANDMLALMRSEGVAVDWESGKPTALLFCSDFKTDGVEPEQLLDVFMKRFPDCLVNSNDVANRYTLNAGPQSIGPVPVEPDNTEAVFCGCDQSRVERVTRTRLLIHSPQCVKFNADRSNCASE
ncbi:hypothetical protein [Ruegeria sp. HKCCD7559]|uniref:hypothetical protein n=1 Tax=Ruegeria sp. HKCCD7559 TaxID=2683005 RepID=UPI001490EA16|nr:hypothetical protein [Ruegeria sp. HKCCD7559]NOC43689.1 hypothetical protein [Ruegeria sp. HKCCD7559]